MQHQLLVKSDFHSSDASPETRNERSIFVVVGMHRSGTSLCSNVLGLLGVDMTDEVGENHSNPLGHFERWEIMKLHEEVLGLFDRKYYSNTHDYPLPPAWWADFRLRPIKERLKLNLAPVMSRTDLLGFKDPRTTRLMPMWNQIFTELRLRPRFIICIRNPAHVAASLLARDNLELEIGEMRALDYVVEALRHTRGRDRCFIRYDDWMMDPMLNATKLLNFVNSSTPIETRDLEIAVHTVVRPEANRSGHSKIIARQPLIRNFYDLVNRFAESNGTDPSLDSSIESFTQSYIALRQVLGPFGAQFKKIEKERSDIEAERASASKQLAEAQQALAAERAAMAKSTDALLAAQAKTRLAEAALAEKAKRVEELTAALTASDAERSRLREAQGTAAQKASSS